MFDEIEGSKSDSELVNKVRRERKMIKIAKENSKPNVIEHIMSIRKKVHFFAIYKLHDQ